MAKTHIDTIEHRDLVTRSLCVRAQSINEAERSVEAIVATETRAMVFDWSNWEIIEEILLADGFRSAEQVPMLETHMAYSLDNVLGSARGLKRSGKTVQGRLFFAEGDETAERAWQKVRQGHLTDVSVGYRIGEGAVRCDPGEKISINGKTYKAGKLPLRVVPDWQIKEVSLVPIGADEAAKIRSAADGGGSGPGGLAMAKSNTSGARSAPGPAAAIEEVQIEEGATGEAPAEEGTGETQVPQKRAAPKPRATATDVPPAAADTEALKRQARQEERARVDAIRGLAGEDIPAELLKRAIDEDWPVETAGLKFREYANKTRTASVQVTDTVEQGQRQGLILSMCYRAGLPLKEEEVRQAAPFMGFGLRAMAQMCVQRMGLNPIGMGVEELWQRSISTAHLPNLLGDAAARILHDRYEMAPSTWRQMSVEREASDFRTQNDIKVAYATTPQDLGPGGKVPLGYLTDSKETYKLGSKGLAIAISFEQFVNDNLSGFLRLPAEMTDDMVRAEDDAGFDLLCSASGLGPTMGEDSKTMFATDRTTPNYYAHSTDSDICQAGLTIAKKYLTKLQGPGGRTLNLTPRFLLCPPELEVKARMWTGNAPLAYTTPTSGAASFQPTKNIWEGMAQVLVEARLSSKTNGTTAWYVIPDPARCPIFVRVYLAGSRTPKLSTYRMEGHDNLVWQILGYFAAGIIDWRCIRMKGAA